jgi:hypothetical protein
MTEMERRHIVINHVNAHVKFCNEDQKIDDEDIKNMNLITHCNRRAD